MLNQTCEAAGLCGDNIIKKKLFSEIPYLKGKRLTLKGLARADQSGLQELVDSPRVYRYLPTFLFEQKYPDTGIQSTKSVWATGFWSGTGEKESPEKPWK